MRVLMLTQFYAPIPGGEERHIQDLSRELVRRGNEVAVVTLWKEGLAPFEVSDGVRIYRVKGLLQQVEWLYKDEQRPHVPPLPDLLITRQIAAIIRTERPEIVHGHNWLVYSFLPIKAYSGAKLVVTLHDYSLGCAKKRLMYRNAMCSGPALLKCLGCATSHYGLLKGIPTVAAKWSMALFERGLVDMFVPVSNITAVGNGLLQRKLPFRVVPNFVPPLAATEEPPDEALLHGLPTGDFLLFVGDLCQDKGIDILIEAYAGLAQAPPLVLIGRKCVDTPAIMPSNVLVLGPMPHQAILEAWRRSTIALMPSTWPEPFGIVALEAMAMARPVIASCIGGLADIVVDGGTGLLVPPNDPVALREAMARLLSDKELRHRLGVAGHVRVAMFDKDQIVPQIEGIYAELLGRPVAAPQWDPNSSSSDASPVVLMAKERSK